MRFARCSPLLRAAVLSVAALATLGWMKPGEAPYDLIVYGATPQGVSAACAAARHGLHVLLLEGGQQVGGVLTQGWLATLDSSNGSDGLPLYRGLFLRFFRSLGYDPSFDVGRAERSLEAMLGGYGVDVRFGERLQGVEVRGETVERLLTASAGGQGVWTAPEVIDASDTADLAALAGAPFTLGRADTGLDEAQMAATLVFRLTGVSWDALGQALAREEADDRQPVGWHGRSAFGFARLAAGYQPSDPARFALRGLNLARQEDGSLLVNALQIFGVDGTRPASVARARQEAAAEAQRVVAYLRQAAPRVFGTAAFGGVAPELYVRESRHLVGLYRLSAPDALFGAAFPDGVARGGYPLDGQRYRPSEGAYMLGTPAPYEVPLRALLPQGLGNLLVVSQAASFDSTAAFSARVVPLQMALGEAAGEAVWEARRRAEALAALPQDASGMAALRARLGLRRDWPDRRTEEAGEGGYATAASLLQRGLFNAPYSLRGELDLAAPIGLADFLANLGHLYAARPAPPGFWAAWRAARPHDSALAAAPLSQDAANALLARLGLPTFAPDPAVGVFTRGRAARVLYGLLLQADEKADQEAPLP